MAAGQILTTAPTARVIRQHSRLNARAGQLLLPLPLLLFAGIIPLLQPTDSDYWWHLRTGQLIADTGTVPRVDDFSFTVTGQPWISHEWLTDFLIFIAAREIGYAGVAAIFGTVSALTLDIVYLTCRLRGASPLMGTLLCTWALLLMQPAQCPPTGADDAPAGCLRICFDLLSGGKAARPLNTPPADGLWVNPHGGYLIGLVLLGLTILGAVARQRIGQRDTPVRPLVLLTLLAALASFLTPHGLDALRYPLTYVGRENASLQFVAEWKSPDFHQVLFFPFAASLLLLVTLGLGGRPLRPVDLFWGVTVAFMALQSVRHIPLYAIIATPLLAARLGVIEWEAMVRSIRTRQLTRFGLGILAMIVPLCLITIAWQLSGSPGGARQFAREPSAVSYPAGAADYLRAAAPAGRLFNEYRWGGYLIAQHYPERRVFIDGRADPFGDTLFMRYRETALARPGWRDTLDEWQIGLVLVERDGPLAAALRDDPAWQELYAGEVERLFARR